MGTTVNETIHHHVHHIIQPVIEKESKFFFFCTFLNECSIVCVIYSYSEGTYTHHRSHPPSDPGSARRAPTPNALPCRHGTLFARWWYSQKRHPPGWDHSESSTSWKMHSRGWWCLSFCWWYELGQQGLLWLSFFLSFSFFYICDD